MAVITVGRDVVANILDSTGIAWRWGGSPCNYNVFPPRFKKFSDEDLDAFEAAITSQGWSFIQGKTIDLVNNRHFVERDSTGFRIVADRTIVLT